MIILLADIFLSSVANVCVETASVLVKIKLFFLRLSLSRIQMTSKKGQPCANYTKL